MRARALTPHLHFASVGRMSLFITCPVESVERATAFYTALGWTLNAEMSDHNVSCFAIAPEQYVMLGSREMYASVGGVEELVGGRHTPSKVTVSFDLGSREAVDDAGVEARTIELATRVAADPELARMAVANFRKEVVNGAIPWDVAMQSERPAQMWSMRRSAQ